MNLTTFQLIGFFVAVGTSWFAGGVWMRLLVSRYLRDMAESILVEFPKVGDVQALKKKPPLEVAAAFLRSAALNVLTASLWVYIGRKEPEKLKKP